MRVWQVCVVALVLVLAVEGGRRGRKKDRKDRTGVCKYKGRAIVGECDTATNTKQVAFKLKKGRSAPDCQPLQVKSVACDDDSYDRKARRRNKKQKKMRCKYERKGTRSECDPVTNRLTVTRQLKPNQPAECQAVKTKEKKCRRRDRKEKRVCRFDKEDWSPCTDETTHSHRKLTPKPDSPEQCKALTQTRQCSQLAELTGAKASKCRYKAGSWSDCDPRSDTMTKEFRLKNGDPNVCTRVKTITRKCKNKCRFRRGEWTECDLGLELKTRVDTLVKGNPKFCDATRTITRKCKKACKYTWGDWSECSVDTNQRARVGTLTKGDPTKCQATTTNFRSCINRNGEERCFFGEWEDFGPCQNGVMTKRRKLLQGGVECERKAAMNRACDDFEATQQ